MSCQYNIIISDIKQGDIVRNRAKCKLCKSIIESKHEFDYVTCGCNEISISGGQIRLECSANDWANFLRVDDLDNVIVPKIVDQNNHDKPKQETEIEKPTRKELLDLLHDMITRIEELPQQAMITPINHYDFLSALLLLLSILRADCSDDS